MFQIFKPKHVNFIDLHKAADNLINNFPPVKKRRRTERVFKILKYSGLAAVGLFLVSVILFSVEIIGLAEAYQQAISGKANLEQAAAFSRQNELASAMASAGAAGDNFDYSLNSIDQIQKNYFFGKFNLISGQLDDIESLLVAARLLSKAVYNGAAFGASLENLLLGDKKLNFSKLSQAERRQVLRKIYESTPELNGIKANLDLAYLNLEQASLGGALFPLREKVVLIKAQINEARQILGSAVPMSQLIPALTGYPEKAKYLVMLQNNDELRPTGGFLGTYGILELEDGEIAKFETHDIYHLDMPVKDKINIIPPEPIRKYLVPKWYLRDANWSPDWPTAAEKIDWFYQAESRLNPSAGQISEFDGVIALTPALITEFLKIIGPVTVEGQSYNEINFQDLLQYRVEKGYIDLGVSSWNRKEVISQIAKELKNEIFNLPPAGWLKALGVMLDSLARKDLLLYLRDSQLENIVMENGWGGEVKSVAGDFVMVVDANLAALKTDSVMSRGLKYKASQGRNGWLSELNLSYAHRGKPDWKISAYKSYTRIYVPRGSRLIGVGGYDLGQIEVADELDKTYFGFYLQVKPGETKNISVKYELPASVLLAQTYSLYLQKQPGKEMNEVKVDLSFLNDIKSYSPAGVDGNASPTNFGWKGDLNVDRSFKIEF